MTVNEKIDLIMRWIVAVDLKESIAIKQKIYDELNNPKPGTSKASIQDKIEDLLRDIGITQSNLGFDYLKCAIELVVEDRSYLRAITSRLYPDIASRFDSNAKRAERVMRHAIKLAFDNYINSDITNAVFGNAIPMKTGKPNNSNFIASCANYIRRQIREEEVA